jgi:hypothetical protein
MAISLINKQEKAARTVVEQADLLFVEGLGNIDGV